MPDYDYTLLTWIARNHDPEHVPRDADEGTPPVPGPTITLLTHNRSPYRGRVGRVVILSQTDRRSLDAVERTKRALRKLGVREILERRVELSGPTDHIAIREAVLPTYRKLLAEQKHGQKLLVNLSPGTPAMHAVWLLLTQTDPAFERKGVLVETREERHARPGEALARAVDLDLRTEFKLHASRVLDSASPETPPIVGPGELKSPKLRAFYEEAERVARLRVPVLIRGERGTGKTTVASFIRSKTPRSGKTPSDVAWQVACGSFSPDLLAAELFGYVKGAFTGATKDTAGLLETIGDGALFLDEVGDLTKPMQRTLIKVVEEREYRSVGARVARPTSARFIFATNVDDADLAERVHADFLDRVGYIRLHVPPLRECREDVPALWRRVASTAGARADFDLDGRLDDAAHKEVVNRVQGDPLPGNFRDLYRVAYRLCVELQRATSVTVAIDAAFASPAPLGHKQGGGDPFTAAVEAWLRDEPLDGVLKAHGSVPIKGGAEELKSWLARRLKDAANTLRLKHGSVSDLPARTLHSWAAGDDG